MFTYQSYAFIFFFLIQLLYLKQQCEVYPLLGALGLLFVI